MPNHLRLKFLTYLGLPLLNKINKCGNKMLKFICYNQVNNHVTPKDGRFVEWGNIWAISIFPILCYRGR